MLSSGCTAVPQTRTTTISGSQRSRHTLRSASSFPLGKSRVCDIIRQSPTPHPHAEDGCPTPPTQGPIFKSDLATTEADSYSCPTAAELVLADLPGIRGCDRPVLLGATKTGGDVGVLPPVLLARVWGENERERTSAISPAASAASLLLEGETRDRSRWNLDPGNIVGHLELGAYAVGLWTNAPSAEYLSLADMLSSLDSIHEALGCAQIILSIWRYPSPPCSRVQ
ncbi:hypothetical protein BDW74DRAFT_113440 [Aspergillus multicolor]|uniref:uncharacterized protein n=1 Tax=Aspergillus multicolor TaxID=41759 RepID=UPI003CCCA900